MALTDYAIELADAWLPSFGFRLASPRQAERRGAHLSLYHQQAWQICQALIDRGVVPDYRTPDRLRLGFAALTTSFADVWDAFDRIRTLVVDGGHGSYPAEPSRVT
jgi:kynureninase